MNRRFIQDYTELRIYELAVDSAMQIYQEIQAFPKQEEELLIRDLVGASRWICAYLAEAWVWRGATQEYENKVVQMGSAAARMQVWIEFGIQCGYLDAEIGQELYQAYGQIRQEALRWMGRSGDRAGGWD